MSHMSTQPGQPRIHASGMTTGQHLFHLVLTLVTMGLWAPVWILLVWLGRVKERELAKPAPGLETYLDRKAVKPQEPDSP